MSVALPWPPAEAPSRRAAAARLRRFHQGAARAPSDALLGHDIFVSYSRRDALGDARALADCSLLMLPGEGGRLRLARASDGADMGGLAGHTASLTSVLRLPRGKVLTTSLDKTARLWDVGSRSLIATLASATAGLHAAGLSHDGRRLLTVDGAGGARLWALWGDDPAELLRTGRSTLGRCLGPEERAENYLDPEALAGTDPSYCKRPAVPKP